MTRQGFRHPQLSNDFFADIPSPIYALHHIWSEIRQCLPKRGELFFSGFCDGSNQDALLRLSKCDFGAITKPILFRQFMRYAKRQAITPFCDFSTHKESIYLYIHLVNSGCPHIFTDGMMGIFQHAACWKMLIPSK